MPVVSSCSVPLLKNHLMVRTFGSRKWVGSGTPLDDTVHVNMISSSPYMLHCADVMGCWIKFRRQLPANVTVEKCEQATVCMQYNYNNIYYCTYLGPRCLSPQPAISVASRASWLLRNSVFSSLASRGIETDYHQIDSSSRQPTNYWIIYYT